MLDNLSIKQFKKNDFIFSSKHEYTSSIYWTYIFVMGFYLIFIIAAIIITLQIDVRFYVNAYLFIFSFCIAICAVMSICGLYTTIRNYCLLQKLKKPMFAENWKNKFIQSRFTNVYYLLIAKHYDLLSEIEYATKKHEFVNKKYITNEEFIILSRYTYFLLINDNDFAKQKQNFLNNNEKISHKNLNELLNRNKITDIELKYKKLNFDKYLFHCIWLSSLLFVVCLSNYLFHII